VPQRNFTNVSERSAQPLHETDFYLFTRFAARNLTTQNQTKHQIQKPHQIPLG
jgi:hypothetical protein